MSPNRFGRALWNTDSNKSEPVTVRIRLTPKDFVIQREEYVYTHTRDVSVDPNMLARERVVIIRRERVGGLGLSVKGGSEHNLPVLISRIFKDQAADKTGQLFVGDAIIKVNSTVIDGANHDVAVSALKCAGDEVALEVKYFRPAELFFSRNRRPSRDEENNQSSDSTLSRQWSDVTCINLQYAYLTRYVADTDKYRGSSFELYGADGNTSGIITIVDAHDYLDWIQNIQCNITSINTHNITAYNKTVIPSQQISHLSWVCIREHTSWYTYTPVLLALRGADICLYDAPPEDSKEWSHADTTEKIYESMFQIVKDAELLDNRQHCFIHQFGENGSRYIACETREDLYSLEKAWYHSNCLAVRHIGSRTFGCTWRGRLSGLTLDLSAGFSLYDSENKSFMWNYRFSQLKGSSDDGKSILKLHFSTEHQPSLQTRELSCTKLQTLLFSIHAFLSAKLASVDLSFLINS